MGSGEIIIAKLLAEMRRSWGWKVRCFLSGWVETGVSIHPHGTREDFIIVI